MSESKTLSEHPRKVTVGYAGNPALNADDGWIDMDVKWLVTSENVGAENTVFGLHHLPPGAKHDIPPPTPTPRRSSTSSPGRAWPRSARTMSKSPPAADRCRTRPGLPTPPTIGDGLDLRAGGEP